MLSSHCSQRQEVKELKVHMMERSNGALEQEHPEMLTSMANLASTYQHLRSMEETEEKKELGIQVTETMKRVLGTEYPSTLTSMNNRASQYGGAKDKHGDVFNLMEQCALLVQLLSDDQSCTKTSRATRIRLR